MSWLHFAGGGKDEITDQNSGAGLPWRALSFPLKITFNVDGNLKNRQMIRNRIGIQVRV